MRLLLLAGTGEARQLAGALAGRGIDTIASLAGGTRAPAPLSVPTRVGGFGGAAQFCDYLRRAGITAVLDATHPFAARISQRTWDVCCSMQMPYAQLLRPEWSPSPDDRWHPVADEAAAVRLIPQNATVFLATGPHTAATFAGLAGRVICRRIDPPDTPFPFPNGDWLVGRPPFSVADEVALFRDLSIDWLVTKNAGGAGARAKLDACRVLAIPVAMIARPAPTPGPLLTTVEDALDWVGRTWSDG